MPTPKGYRHKKIGSAKSCAPGSFRRVKSGKSLLTICCPKGKWSRGRCRVGTRAVGLDKPYGDAAEMRSIRARMERVSRKVNCAACARACR